MEENQTPQNQAQINVHAEGMVNTASTLPINNASATEPIPPVPPLNTTPPPVPPIPPQVSVGLANKKKLLIILAIILLSLIIITGTAFAMVAYNKLSLGSPAFRMRIGDAVMSIPFMPKTAEYVLRKSLLKSMTMDKFGFNASLAVAGVENPLQFGSSNIDFEAKGSADISNLDNPLLTSSILLTKDFLLDLRLKDQKMYVKINKLPASILSFLPMLGMPTSLTSELMSNWIHYDLSSADTEARKLQAELKNKDELKDTAGKVTSAFYDGTLKVKTSLTKDIYFGKPMYKITMIWDENAVRKLNKILSDSLDPESARLEKSSYTTEPMPSGVKYSPIKVTIVVDKKDYYINRLLLTTSFKYDSADLSDSMVLGANPFFSPDSLQGKNIPVTFVLNYTDIGKPVNVKVPKNSIGFEQLIERIMRKAEEEEGSPSAFFDPVASFKKANNVKRKSDIHAILNAVYQYTIDNRGLMPSEITSVEQPISKKGADLCSNLAAVYIAGLPVDPSLGDKTVYKQECDSDYDTGYTIFLSPGGKITIRAPKAELNDEISVTR